MRRLKLPNLRGGAILLSLIFSCSLLASCLLQASEAEQNGQGQEKTEDDEVVKAFLKQGGEKFRVSVIQSGDYYFYAETLASIYSGLAELGWAEAIDFDADDKASVPNLLTRIADSSSYLSFPMDLFVDLNWDEDPGHLGAFNELLEGKKKADIVISLGTLAGVFVKEKAENGSLKVPVLIESVSDPLGSGIIKGYDDPGYEFITASCDPGAYARQIRLFHQIVGFKKLGLLYTDTEIGRSYAALSDVEAAAKELGFEIVPYTDVLEDPPDEKDIPLAQAKYVEGIRKLSGKVDAFYLAIQAGLSLESLPRILEVTRSAKVPNFAMEGSDFVQRGVMLGESNNVLNAEGLYSARKITRILKGDSPRILPQINSHTPHIAVNLKAAEEIGFDIPVDIVLSADDVFTGITVE